MRFVRRTCILLQRGKIVAADALLGRFLPRLGPLVATQAALCFAGRRSLLREKPFKRQALVKENSLAGAYSAAALWPPRCLATVPARRAAALARADATEPNLSFFETAFSSM